MSTPSDRRAAARLPRRHNDVPTPAADRLLTLLAEWRRRLRSRAALARLCDRDLRDIGLTRSDLARECAKPFWRA
jgi:uncharacterized protein YjiS (DUF1127 family)